MYTRSTNQLWVDESFFGFFTDIQCNKQIDETENKLNKYIEKVYEELDTLPLWTKINDQDIYYIRKYDILMPDITVYRCSVVNENKFDNNFGKFTGRIIKENEALDLFFLNRSKNPFFVDDIWFTSAGNNHCVVRYLNREDETYECMNTQGNRSCCHKNFHNNCPSCSWGYGLKIPVFDLTAKSTVENFVLYDIVPEELSETCKSILNILCSLHVAGYIEFEDKKIVFADKFREDILNDKIDEILGVSFKKSDFEYDIQKYSQENPIQLEKTHIDKYLKNILECDKNRASIETYDPKRLTDPNEGMWDLWEDEGKYDGKISIKTNFNFIGRNPVADIKEDGIVGIDFGTKSTIVVYQNGNDTIMPMRIGLGTMSAQITPEQYENPTVMEIKNLENFLRCYNSREGRPPTEWADITVSHTAHNNLTSSTATSDFYSYFYDLKQWCADNEKYRIVTIKDQCENEYELSPYMSDDEKPFDPIEVYAYYLGLYINNMHNGIYLDYLLSFPITYQKELREKILKSFEKGLKKSLPQTIINNQQYMDEFSVTNGVSEPVAYAITAFTEFGLKPHENQEYLYGVFDFGGGTTDFSFGTYSRSDISEKKKYDYVITCINYGGDRYLGGENLLELLAYNIFRANYKKLLKRDDGFCGIQFTCPSECESFLGAETLISTSRKAKRNMKQLMEKLRPYWENLGYERSEISSVRNKASETLSQIEKGFIRVDLFDNSGNLIHDFELDIYNEKTGLDIKLDEIIENRIERGVRQFFSALSDSFSESKLIDSNGIEIFLAGNSGKSPVLRKLFDKYSKVFSNAFKSGTYSQDSIFHIYPSLGTNEAVEIQRKNGIDAYPGELSGPTGKTGVAYGIIKGRVGSRIKIVSNISDGDEPVFYFNLGHCEDDKFICDITNKNLKSKWIEFGFADASRIEIYYTDMPESTENALPIHITNKKIIRIKKIFENASLYVRVKSQNSLEYVISTPDGILSDDYLTEVSVLEF
ncbi:MAG: hypothetical protein J6A58_06885 [Oscillospiraceae bacterium]|nr:hypothetical protein [Oscillospiraceae bacterium]